MSIGRSTVWLVSLASLLLPFPSDGKPSRSSEALEEVNRSARAAYAAARERALSALGPVVLWNGEELIFRYGSVRQTSRPTPTVYNDLKTVGHVVLGLHALVALQGDGDLDDRRRFELTEFRELVEKTRKAIRDRGLTKDQLARQEKILDGCDEYLNTVLREGKIEVKQAVTALRKLRPLLDVNSAEAARGQIDGLHRRMESYRAKLSAADWKRLRVIVQGSQQLRKDHLAVQYFSRLLGEPGEGSRIIYAEGLFDETKALALLGTKLLDLRIGADIWGDPQHMYRDLLADGASTYLDELFKKK
jgi:hypothetical protein